MMIKTMAEYGTGPILPRPNVLIGPSGGPKKIEPPEKKRNSPSPMKVVANVTITAFALKIPTAVPLTNAKSMAAARAARMAGKSP